MSEKKRVCPECGDNFPPKTYRHVFCCRKCFKKDYERKKTKFPSYRCPECGVLKKLDFFPKKDLTRWENYKCECGCENRPI